MNINKNIHFHEKSIRCHRLNISFDKSLNKSFNKNHYSYNNISRQNNNELSNKSQNLYNVINPKNALDCNFQDIINNVLMKINTLSRHIKNHDVNNSLYSKDISYNIKNINQEIRNNFSYTIDSVGKFNNIEFNDIFENNVKNDEKYKQECNISLQDNSSLTYNQFNGDISDIYYQKIYSKINIESSKFAISIPSDIGSILTNIIINKKECKIIINNNEKAYDKIKFYKSKINDILLNNKMNCNLKILHKI